jgi:hypothetical protein
MPRVCGPILGWRGQDGGSWRVSVMVAHRGGDAPAELSYGVGAGDSTQQTAALQPLGSIGGIDVFGADLSLPLAPTERAVSYGFAGEDKRWTLVLPAQGRAPRIAYASCNGFSLPGDMKKIADKNALWRDVAREHGRQPFHMLLLGGDQIYADQLWDQIPELARFNERPRTERARRPAGAGLRRAIERFYADIYASRFSQAEVAEALASMPTLMMWDDHDIFDGWGSYSPEEQASPVFQAIFAAARGAFALFQLQTDPASPAGRIPGQSSFNALFRFETGAALVLDLRSERTQQQILSLESWNAVLAAVDASDGLKHLLVMSSIPVLHPDMSFVERAFDLLPGQQGNEDDLHDQWLSYNHKTERLRFIHRLLDFAEAKGTRVTIVSGDVHVAALGVIQSERRPVRHVGADAITQLTASAIVHPPPARVVRYFLEQIGSQTQEIDRDIEGEMQVFPGTNYRFVAERNWMTLDFDDKDRIWVNWRIENAPQPLTKVIHPCTPVAMPVA